MEQLNHREIGCEDGRWTELSESCPLAGFLLTALNVRVLLL